MPFINEKPKMKITAMGKTYQEAIDAALRNTQKSLKEKMGFVPRFMLVSEQTRILFSVSATVSVTFLVDIYEGDLEQPLERRVPEGN